MKSTSSTAHPKSRLIDDPGEAFITMSHIKAVIFDVCYRQCHAYSTTEPTRALSPDWWCCNAQSVHCDCCIREETWHPRKLPQLLDVNLPDILVFHELIIIALSAVQPARGRDSREENCRYFRFMTSSVVICPTLPMGTCGTRSTANEGASVRAMLAPEMNYFNAG